MFATILVIKPSQGELITVALKPHTYFNTELPVSSERRTMSTLGLVHEAPESDFQLQIRVD